jgi:hypothetical protein
MLNAVLFVDKKTVKQLSSAKEKVNYVYANGITEVAEEQSAVHIRQGVRVRPKEHPASARSVANV